MERKLASIQKVNNIEPIEGADKIEVASILGWKCVVRKGEFKVGDWGVYFEIDSILPKTEWSSFLFKDNREKVRIKTVKLRKQISQGLFMPITILGDSVTYEEGYDVTQLLGIDKYEPYIPAQLAGEIKGSFPMFIPKTDETRIQAFPELLNMMGGKDIYVTEKVDGTSTTFYMYNGEFGVCSRNIDLKPSGNVYWQMAQELNLQEKFTGLKKNIAIQGEIFGQGIQGNKLKLDKVRFACYNVYDIDNGKYYDFTDMVAKCQELNIETVPILFTSILNGTVDTWVAKVNGMKSTYNPNVQAEGIVVRGITEQNIGRFGRFSFKVINNEFLLEHGE